MREGNVMIRILAVDDDREILTLMKRALEREGYEVDTVEDPNTLQTETLERYQLILLDVMMPGTDGFTLCRRIRELVDCPILFVTAKTEEKDLMYGLGIGGDDYIVKPFGIGELRARVAAHLRRENREKRHVMRMGNLVFSLQAKQLFYKEQEISLTKSEYAICEYLALNRGCVFSKEQIYEHVFGYDGEADSSAITEHVKNIRAKLQKYGETPIETVWGIGYRWK
jgi:two-component system, OmpR family, lantibiotic biosynthesis response regulator NisR/SpaR